MNDRHGNLPASIFIARAGKTISRAAFLAMERTFRNYQAELGAMNLPARESAELYHAGLVEAPKGHGGAVQPTDLGWNSFVLTDGCDLTEPRNAFEGTFVPIRAAWEATSASTLPQELQS